MTATQRLNASRVRKDCTHRAGTEWTTRLRLTAVRVLRATMHHRIRSCVIVRAALRVRQMTTATPGLHAKSVHSAPTPPVTKTLSPSPTRHGASPALLARLTTTPTRVRPVIRALRGQRTQLQGQAMPRHVWIVRRVGGHRRREPQRAWNVQPVCSVDRSTDACRATRQKANDARPARHIRWQQPGTSPSSPRAPQARTQQPSQRASLSRTRVLGHAPTRMRRTSQRKTPSPRRSRSRASAAVQLGWARTAARSATEARGVRCATRSSRAYSARMQLPMATID